MPFLPRRGMHGYARGKQRIFERSEKIKGDLTLNRRSGFLSPLVMALPLCTYVPPTEVNKGVQVRRRREPQAKGTGTDARQETLPSV